MNVAGQYHNLSEYDVVNGFYRIPVDYDKILEWSKKTSAGNTNVTSPVEVYIGVEKNIILQRAKLQFETDNNPSVVELREALSRLDSEINALNEKIKL